VAIPPDENVIAIAAAGMLRVPFTQDDRVEPRRVAVPLGPC
jgi:hypothetical protein